mmetsp:Transcript_59597/g.158567  ORF Transcript_59597/g.158567 Transcript_59597/m.158567 type:complete len:274 (-) Transcript_59597:345-1166(-)
MNGMESRSLIDSPFLILIFSRTIPHLPANVSGSCCVSSTFLRFLGLATGEAGANPTLAPPRTASTVLSGGSTTTSALSSGPKISPRMPCLKMSMWSSSSSCWKTSKRLSPAPPEFAVCAVPGTAGNEAPSDLGVAMFSSTTFRFLSSSSFLSLSFLSFFRCLSFLSFLSPFSFLSFFSFLSLLALTPGDGDGSDLFFVPAAEAGLAPLGLDSERARAGLASAPVSLSFFSFLSFFCLSFLSFFSFFLPSGSLLLLLPASTKGKATFLGSSCCL